MKIYDVEDVFQGFWKDIVCKENGELDTEQVKRELCDYYKMLREVPYVYSAVTGGLLSKPIYDAKTVIDIFYEQYGDKAFLVESIADDWDDITADCATNDEYKKAIFHYFNIVAKEVQSK